jgi:ribosome maturation factor RimP
MAVKRSELFGVLEPTVSRMGFELADLEVQVGRGRGLVRLFIDRPEGVTLDDCEAVSREVSAILDVEDPVPAGYTLEVSSPGLDRRLRKPEHFDRFAGLEVQLRLRTPLDGRRRFTGELIAREGEAVTVRCEGVVFRFALPDIEEARLVPDL